MNKNKIKKYNKNKQYNKNLLITLLIITLTVTSILFINRISNNKRENITGNSILNIDNLSELKIKVAIPCPGHAALIEGELLKIQGVGNIDFSFPNIFTIKYDSKQISEQDILNLNIFTEYPAKRVN